MPLSHITKPYKDEEEISLYEIIKSFNDPHALRESKDILKVAEKIIAKIEQGNPDESPHWPR
jgi:hypothetical protein